MPGAENRLPPCPTWEEHLKCSSLQDAIKTPRKSHRPRGNGQRSIQKRRQYLKFRKVRRKEAGGQGRSCRGGAPGGEEADEDKVHLGNSEGTLTHRRNCKQPKIDGGWGQRRGKVGRGWKGSRAWKVTLKALDCFLMETEPQRSWLEPRSNAGGKPGQE